MRRDFEGGDLFWDVGRGSNQKSINKIGNSLWFLTSGSLCVTRGDMNGIIDQTQREKKERQYFLVFIQRLIASQLIPDRPLSDYADAVFFL